MTRKDAAEKVAKLERLAEGTENKAEAETARKTARKIASEHGLSDSELMIGAKAAAFDELVTALDTYAAKNNIPPAVSFALDKIKKEHKEDDKAASLDKIVKASRFAGMLFGRDVTVKKAVEVIEETLHKYKIKY